MLSYDSLSQSVTELCRDLCLNDFAALTHRTPQTHGEKLFVEFGIIGIRGETEQGFPLVRNVGLPALHFAISQGLGWRESLIHTLLSLMANCDDTTVLSRGKWKALNEMKRRAQELVELGGMFYPDIERALTDFNKWCMKKWLSPGGSADLLALCLAMYFLCNQASQKLSKEGE
jgi:triphosphoribosyl-dephospho-CoA synthase